MLSFVRRFRASSRAAPRLSRSYRTQTPKEVLTSSDEDHELPAIPPLRRPLGVLDVPTTKTRTLSEATADFLNQEKQLEKRRHLCVVISI